MSSPRALVLMPTFNEAENLGPALDAIFAAQPEINVLVIDDASPDGTGDMADARAAEDQRVHVLHRQGKEGLGKAYLAGFAWGLGAKQGYTHLIEMDADLSHDPKYLGDLLGACASGADVAVGSRYVRGGGTQGWPWHRELLSRGGGLYARSILGFGVRDPTAGFVCFRREVLERLPLDRIQTRGYGFQIEMKYRCHQMGFRIDEVPIVFVERERGASKMNSNIAFEALGQVVRLRLSGKMGANE